MHPRHPRPKGVGGTKFFKLEVLASGGLILGIEPSCPPSRVVLGHPQYEILNVGAHRAVETTGLIVKRAPDDENPLPQRPMGSIPRKHSHSVMKHAMCRMVLGFRSWS
jgi:hypothetical protein